MEEVMISKARNQILGEYFLNWFIIKCNVDIDFENLSNSDTHNQLGTFFHEYIHFLQNASTTYGNMNMKYFYAKTMNILYNIYYSSEKEIKRIVQNNPYVEFAENFYNITMGDVEVWTYDSYDYIRIIDAFFVKDEIYGDEYEHAIVPKLRLQLFKGVKAEIKEFEFGAMAIMESMTSLLERHFYDKVFVGVQPQYDICKILWNFLAPQYKDKEELIVAACECSLMYENPASIFYNITKHIISRKEKPLNIDDIANIFKKSIKPDFEKAHKENFEEMNRLFGDLVPYKNEFCNLLNKYVCNFCNELFSLRKSNYHFLSDLMVKTSSDSRRGLLAIMNKTKAMPLIISKNNEVYSGHEETDKMGMVSYLAFYSFNKMFGISGNNQCYMLDVCKGIGDDRVNSVCICCPWEKVNEKKLCPMAQIWYMWQLQGKKIVD